jgi:hypothetical protein
LCRRLYQSFQFWKGYMDRNRPNRIDGEVNMSAKRHQAACIRLPG